ncbi:MAG: rod shape-determining protein MreD [Proteobacteria bacterium]|nr:rod shape-determining protein MreD [Pseudomonadota bacterium]
MSDQQRAPRLTLIVSSLLALLLCGLPLPRAVDALRPDLLLLVVIWFALMKPRAGGLVYAWLAGLALDAFRGIVLGQNALAFVMIAFLVHRFHLRVRMFPLSQQSLFVMSLLWLYQFTLFWVDGVTGHPLTDWARWLPALTGTLLWPVFAGLMDRITARG